VRPLKLKNFWETPLQSVFRSAAGNATARPDRHILGGSIMSKRILAALIGFGMMLGFSTYAHAVPSYATSFKSTYPSSPLSSLSTTSGVAGNLCTLCHGTSGGSRNPYGSAYSSNGHSFTAIQNLDSDNDGFTNLVEINAGTFPGTSASKPAAAACTSYTYSAWSACQPNNTQTRTVLTSLPAGCSGGVAPVTSQACTYVPPACTSYTYTVGACQPNNTAPVTGYTGIPAGCSGGATPATTQPCTYVPPVTACTSYTYTVGACQPNNTAPVTGYTGIPAGCSGGATPATTQPCTYVPSACTSYTYSAWSACQPNSTQTRSVLTSLPAGCSGGTAPVTSQACTYTPPQGGIISPATSGLVWDDTNKRLGIGTGSPNQLVHAKMDQNGITALRVENQNIFGASSPLAQEQFALGPAGSEHLMLQVLSDSHPTLSGVALMNAYTHDLFFRTNAVNVLKIYRDGAMEDTLVLDNGAVGIGVNMPNQRLEVNGGVRLIPDTTVEPKPVCNVDSRGTFWFTQDDAAGDSAEVCARVAGAYAWRRLF
jgi:hypothetical protein